MSILIASILYMNEWKKGMLVLAPHSPHSRVDGTTEDMCSVL